MFKIFKIERYSVFRFNKITLFSRFNFNETRFTKMTNE